MDHSRDSLNSIPSYSAPPRGRLTEEMFDAIFAQARELLDK